MHTLHLQITALAVLALSACQSRDLVPGAVTAEPGVGFRALGSSSVLKGAESDILTLDYLRANGFAVKAWTEVYDGSAYTYTDLFGWSDANLTNATTGQYATEDSPSWPDNDVAAVAYAPKELPAGAVITTVEASDKTKPVSLELTYPAPALVSDQKDFLIAAGLGKGDNSDGSHSAGISMPFRHVFPDIDIQFATFYGATAVPTQLKDVVVRVAGVKLEGVSNGYRKILLSRTNTPNPDALDNGVRVTDTDLTGSGSAETYFAARTTPVVTAGREFKSVIGDGTQHFYINPQTAKDLDADGDGAIDNGTDFYLSFALNITDSWGNVVFPKFTLFQSDPYKTVADKGTVYEWAKVPVDPALFDGLKPGVKYVFRINYTLNSNGDSTKTLLHDPNPDTPTPDSSTATITTQNSGTPDTPVFPEYVFFIPTVTPIQGTTTDADGYKTEVITINL